ncbi:MAG TPA: fibronectin type III domain-containing protein, partial [Pseudomonas sp.]|nr:fibronectin type III domain-containing protein [Pseudomonas sp.]
SSTTAILYWDEPYDTCDLCPNALGFNVSSSAFVAVEVSRSPYEFNFRHSGTVSVQAIGANGTLSEKSYFEILQSPDAPTHLHVSEMTADGVTLSWKAPSGPIPAFDYLLTHNGQFVTEVRGLTYHMKYSSRQPVYDFEVRARSIAGNISDPALLDITPPSKPAGLFAFKLSSRAIILMWRRSEDNVGVVKYEVLKNGVLIDETKDDLPVYSIAGLIPETPYKFAVQALDSSGNRSEASDPITVTTPVLDPPKNVRVLEVTHSKIVLAWDRPDEAIGLINYKSQADNRNGSFREVVLLMEGVIFSGLKSFNTYYINIWCHDASGRYSEPATLTVKTLRR